MPFLQDPAEPSQDVSTSEIAIQETESNLLRSDSPFDQNEQAKAQSLSQTGSRVDEPRGNSISVEDDTTKKAKQILQVIESYGAGYNSPSKSWKGFDAFVPTVRKKVAAALPIQMVLPAFPMKSPNRKDKVLGRLPDFGEELALHHLNGLCENISDIYDHGAELVIQSDGLVYNDILGVSDEDVWDYGEELRKMAEEKSLRRLKFTRCWDLLDHPGPDDGFYAKDYYLSHAGCLRRELQYRFLPANINVDEAIKNDEDTCLTYRGYLKFLSLDLANDPAMQDLSNKGRDRYISKIARQMIERGKAFAAALKARFPDHVRLSIHDSTGKDKLPMSVVSQPGVSGVAPTPWHSVVAVDVNGTYRTVLPEEVKDTHDLVYRQGRGYYYRERAEMFRWPFPVEIEFQYPTGVIISPTNIHDTAAAPSIREIPIRKARELSLNFSPVVLRGFRDTIDEEQWISKAHEIGTILPWSFGIVQKVKDSGRTDKMGNNVTSNEAMPMHFDGMFKFADKVDPITGETTKVQNPPRYQYFTSPATAPRGTGYTLFASSRLFFRHLPGPFSVDRLEKATWAMDNNGFWDAKLKDLPLVVRHPVDNSPCLRWHQPWDETKTKFSTCSVTIDGESQELVDLIDKLTYDRRVCSYFSWNVGDILVNDNFAMLHTRTSYKTACDRELWRIHFD